MTLVTFRVSWSSFVSIRTTWRRAEDKLFYKDDYLGSSRDSEGAIAITTTVSTALANVDFHLGGLASNDPAVLEAGRPTDKPGEKMDGTSKDLGVDELVAVLGFTWRPSTDMLGFRIKKRRLLSRALD
jgi:hypothetical protein